MKLDLKLFFALLLISAQLAGCGGEAAPTEDVNAIMTAGVGTMVASFFETQTAMVTPATTTPTETQTPFPTVTQFSTPTLFVSPTLVYYTPTLGPTSTPGTPTPTGTLPTATINPSTLSNGCNNLAFIRDVTIPSGTVLTRGQNFTKTWKVQNTGTCEWLYLYSLVLIGGDPFGAGPTRISKLVAVGDWSEVSINMDAPKQGGTYTSYWRMADADGNLFGSTLAVSFVVTEATPTP